MEIPEKIKFHFIKSNYFRVIHVDGAHGGITPNGHIFVSVFNTRAPIPQVAVQRLADNRLGDEVREERVSKDGLVREVEVGLMMDITTAESIHRWLGEKIATLRKRVADETGDQNV
jgi:hypothetical protein